MTLTAAEERGMKFCKSGVDIWTSVNNAYTISKSEGPVSAFLLRDGHGTFLGRFPSKPKAIQAAREDLIVKH